MHEDFTREKFLAFMKEHPIKADCGADFPLDITHSIVVANCGSYTSAEVQRMQTGLHHKWDVEALATCAKNGDSCPGVSTTNFEQKSSSCQKGSDGKNVWTVVATFTGKCIPITLSKKK